MGGMPVPLPGDGSQKVALSHVDDIAELICAAIGKESGIYNCGTDKFMTYWEVAQAVAEALGKPSFPFRPVTFTVNPSKAKSRLGWTGAKHTLVEDLPMWLEQYRAANLDKKEIEE